MFDASFTRYALERFFSDMRAARRMTCSLCDGVINMGDRVMTDPGADERKPLIERQAHRSCVLMPYRQVKAWKERRRHALQHAPKPPEAPVGQLGLFAGNANRKGKRRK